jgi:2-methylaconitate cis-trans-isomerase PrpF
MTIANKLRAVIMRGGTSKAVFLREEDLPRDQATRDAIILGLYGSPDVRQIDGLGGADPLTSKVAIIGSPTREGCDVNYTVGYVGIGRAHIDYEGNCGNISQAVGPFAIAEGLVRAAEPFTTVRIFNTNTKKIIEAEVPVRNGQVVENGDFQLFGVPGTGAKIVLNFVDSAGSKTGKLLPTGHVVDRVKLADGREIEVSCIDASAPGVYFRASDLGLTGREMPEDAHKNPEITRLMEEIRGLGGKLMRLPESPAIPKVGMVSAPAAYASLSGVGLESAEMDLVARTNALGVMHKAYAVTGGISVSTAAMIEGSVVNSVLSPDAKGSGLVRLGHPSGISPFQIEVTRSALGFELRRSAMAGTARRLMEGFAFPRP